MRVSIALAVLSLFLSGCNVVRKALPQYEKDRPNEATTLPDDYTVTGVTTENFQLVPIRVADSVVVVRVRRVGEDWMQCDKFETLLLRKGTGGVRLWYRNLIVGGVARPVAPIGTQYEIRSIVTSTEHSIYGE